MVSTNVWTNFYLTLLVCNFEHCNVVTFNFSHVWAAKMAGVVLVGNRGGKSAVAWQPSYQKISRIGRKFWAS